MREQVIGPAPTLEFGFSKLDRTTGEVGVNGGDSARPIFTFSWGDGQEETGGFPRNHTYQDLTRNYILKVTSQYADGTTDEGELPVFFAAPELHPQPLPATLSVTIPDLPVTLTSRFPFIPPPTGLQAFDDGFFFVIPRATVEYVLTAGAVVEEDLVNSDLVLVDGGFRQVILWEPPCEGCNQAFFYTSPLAVGSGGKILSGYDLVRYGHTHWSVFHNELGHNFQLNSPADDCFGPKADGHSCRILTEGIPRIFQGAVAYELVNDSERYGLGRELALAMEKSAIEAVKEFWSHYQRYLDSDMPFCSWSTGIEKDEPYDTFCTLAIRFFAHAEEQSLGYRVPVKRMMKLVQTFDQEAEAKWDKTHDTAAGATYRSTFMVTALSFAFDEDLREEFRALNFPVSDADYEALWQKADTDPADFSLSVTPATVAVPRARTVTCTVGTEALDGLTHDISFRARLVTPIEGVSVTLSDRAAEPGGSVTITVTADAAAPLTTSSIRLQAEGEYTAHAANIPITVITAPIIASVSFAKKTLTIQGSDFGTGPRVLVNDVDQTARITSAADTAITLKGKKKKLCLHAGENRIVIIDSAGTSSGEFVLSL